MVAWWNLGLSRVVFSPELAPIHRRIEALEQFNRDTRLLCSATPWWSANPFGVLWPEVVTELMAAGNGNGVPADHGTAEQHLKEGKSAIRWTRYHQPVAPQLGAA